MSVNINNTYWAIVHETSGTTFCGGNSKTNGLYSSRSRAQTQYNQYTKRWENWLNSPHTTEAVKESYRKHIDDFKENYRIKEVQVAVV